VRQDAGVKIAPFRIERYYALHEFTAPYMLSSSDAESVRVADLLALEPGAEARLLELRLGYTESPGSPEVRAAIAAMYETTEPDDALVVAAAEEGIFLAYHALLEPGDHVVVETPCYESAVQVARSAGAEITEWRRSAADGWAHDLDALEQALRPDTRLVYVNTPHNPTGTLMPRAVLGRVVELCAERGAWLFSDEVYRELEHDPADRLPAACDLYERALTLGSVSKTYGLPGLRLGWLASRDRDALAHIVDLKHYTTICSSAPSELLAAVALRHRTTIAERNRGIVLANLPLVDAFLERHEGFSWTRPTASPIGFVRVGGVEDATGFCEQVVADTGVLLLPGAVYDEPGHVRIGFGRLNMPDALARLQRWLDTRS
jgi:aspartate/methionine/tyrosine aminotransferase